MRIFALSDIHVDYSENMAWIRALSGSDYARDVLLLAGDACGDIGRIEAALSSLRGKFAQVFFLNGNHELWLLDSEDSDSLQKFHRIMALCRGLDVKTEPARIDDGHGGLWIVPLFSWYDKPDDGPASLFLRRAGPPIEESLDGWADEHLVRWPGAGRASTYFLASNLPHLERAYDAPVISFSHFLPRADLLFPPQSGGAGQPSLWPFRAGFNFSLVAGTSALDHQIRRLDARVHVYGHQHRNRSVEIDGVVYVSTAWAIPTSEKTGRLGYFESGPRLIWEQGRPAVSN